MGPLVLRTALHLRWALGLRPALFAQTALDLLRKSEPLLKGPTAPKEVAGHYYLLRK